MWWLQWEFLCLHALHLISPLMSHNLMLTYSWMTLLDSFLFTLLPQQNKGLQYFTSCYCGLFLLNWAEKPWLHKGTCYKTICERSSLCQRTCAINQEGNNKYKGSRSDIPKVKNVPVDLTVFFLESYLRQLYETWNVVCTRLSFYMTLLWKQRMVSTHTVISQRD